MREAPSRNQTNPLPSLTKTEQLRAMLTSPELEFLMEAHNGLSAKIVEEAGFKGIWASGLSMSAALGVRDNNEASWTQIMDVLEFMADATNVPILVDGDTGWGNFNNMRRAVSKLCQRGIAGICIEDKLFPKTNSFIGEGQPLADMDEFCGKIKAGKDSQTDPNFSIVARLEAFIAGRGLDEALRRAEAYHAAGADAVLVHSKLSTPDEIDAFAKEWAGRCPIVIVPTKYFRTPTDDFRKAGISVAIWANHNLRAAITVMRETSRRIFREQSLAGVDGDMVLVKEVFELTGNDELAEAEKRYLPQQGQKPNAVILAASRGARLGALTEDKPKCMIDVRGKPLLSRLVKTFKDSGVQDIAVVRGYKKEQINLPSITTVDNDLFDNTGEVASLSAAIDHIQGDCIISYGDILFRQYYLDQLLAAEDDITVLVDALWKERNSDADGWVRDLIQCSRPFSGDYLDDDPVSLRRIGNDLDPAEVDGEWIGVAKLSAKGSQLVCDEIAAMGKDGSLPKMSLPDLFARLAEKGTSIRVIYVPGQWLDVDDAADITKAGNFL
ncbi:MAG TPA: phosphoenolpyruvate mutase [Rhodospirillales bacterium]|jgi:phosphoenolpyruvate phosphomutase|nr:MAG: Phosphonopyruvate hydrolase [Alphaproteobacteria bacterium MarineAlpha3_Bin2]HIC29412.1 phosphoenolpyruvate mutase [Rhodospirillales bacterium]